VGSEVLRCGPRARLFLGVVAIVAITALVASACGSGSTSSAKGFRVATMARSMQEAGTARFEGTATFHASGNNSSWTINGAIDFANDRSSAEIRKAEGNDVVTRSVSIGGVTYTADAGALREGLGPATKDKPWVRSEELRAGGPFELTGLGDVAQMLELLDRAGWSGERVGDDEVRGDSTVHYRYTLKDPSAGAPRQVQALDSGYPGDQTIDLWADSQQRLRRYSQTSEGEPVVIEAPPADQVVVDDLYVTTGDWKVIAHGSDGGDDWRVFRLPLRNGECFAHETQPQTKAGDLGVEIRGHIPDQCSHTSGQGSTGFDERDELMDTTVAVALPSGRALLYGQVSDAVRGLTLHFGNGRTERVSPTDGLFAVTMAADEVVEAIVAASPSGETKCPLDPEGFGYSCSAREDGPPASGVPGPSEPGVINTAPPGA
jgi:hypothetical protein